MMCSENFRSTLIFTVFHGALYFTERSNAETVIRLAIFGLATTCLYGRET